MRHCIDPAPRLCASLDKGIFDSGLNFNNNHFQKSRQESLGFSQDIEGTF